MPNGGSDCCGTCWFNSVNRGKPGYPAEPAPGPPTCEIRGGLLIDDPFWRYCANHPHHNPLQIRTPVGPVYACREYPYSRQLWQPSPDSPEVRDRLLALLDAIPPEPEAEYPSPTQFDEEVIRQLAEFREPRAVPGLRRILQFDPDARVQPAGGSPDEVLLGGPSRRDRRPTVGHAVLALAAILGDGAIREVRWFMGYGLDQRDGAEAYAAVRYLAVSGLRHFTRLAALPLLETAARDPHAEVASLARKLLDEPEPLE